jgi:hypothetical protein
MSHAPFGRHRLACWQGRWARKPHWRRGGRKCLWLLGEGSWWRVESGALRRPQRQSLYEALADDMGDPHCVIDDDAIHVITWLHPAPLFARSTTAASPTPFDVFRAILLAAAVIDRQKCPGSESASSGLPVVGQVRRSISSK